MTVDCGMTVVLLLLMGYSRIGETAHEWLGVSMFVLFVIQINCDALKLHILTASGKETLTAKEKELPGVYRPRQVSYSKGRSHRVHYRVRRRGAAGQIRDGRP